MGLTLDTGKRLIWCVIFKNVKCYSKTENGIDFTVRVNSNFIDQVNFIKNNIENGEALCEPLTREDKLFPGDLTCMFNDKVVNCFTRWSESGGISSSILKYFLKPLTIIICYLDQPELFHLQCLMDM